jgi:hypothetical protein
VQVRVDQLRGQRRVHCRDARNQRLGACDCRPQKVYVLAHSVELGLLHEAAKGARRNVPVPAGLAFF